LTKLQYLEKYLDTVVEVFVTTLSICQSLIYLRHTSYNVCPLIVLLECTSHARPPTFPVQSASVQPISDRSTFRVCFLTRLWPTLRDGPSFHGSIAVTQ